MLSGITLLRLRQASSICWLLILDNVASLGWKDGGGPWNCPFGSSYLPPPGVKDFSDWNQAGGMCPAKFWNEATAFWQGPYTKGER